MTRMSSVKGLLRISSDLISFLVFAGEPSTRRTTGARAPIRNAPPTLDAAA